jgi:hypothetical protein
LDIDDAPLSGLAKVARTLPAPFALDDLDRRLLRLLAKDRPSVSASRGWNEPG